VPGGKSTPSGPGYCYEDRPGIEPLSGPAGDGWKRPSDSTTSTRRATVESPRVWRRLWSASASVELRCWILMPRWWIVRARTVSG